MTTTVLRPSATDLPAIRPLRFPTLVAVELRKMLDTRSGRGLLATTIAASAAVLVWKVTHSSVPTSFENYSAGVATMVAFLTPLIGLLAMTSEWTQRTALTTFTLAPRRLPVIAAKYVASIVVALGATAVGLALAATAVAIGGAAHGPADYSGWLGHARYAVIFVLLQVTMGAAFGALAANSTVALSAFLLAPTMWAMLAQSAFKPIAGWLDIYEAYGRLSSDLPLDDVAQTMTAVAVWVVLPAGVGLARSLYREIK
jgi:ABC-type transport system involved in multi-copper enzyme maturation permease subunit